MSLSDILLGWSVAGPVVALFTFYDGEPDGLESWIWFFIISGPLSLLYIAVLKLLKR